MKTILLSLCLSLIAYFAYSQTIILKDSVGNIISNDYLIVTKPDMSTKIETHIHIENNDIIAKSIKIKKYILSEVQGAMHQFCLGINCYDATTTVSTNGITIDPDEEDSTFHFDYFPISNAGSSSYMLVAFDENNPSDSVYVILGININNTSIQEQSDAKIVNIYPIPTSNTLYIEGKNLKEVTKIEVIDMLGKTILKKQILNINNNFELSVTNLISGRYFVKLYSDNNIIVKSFIKE